MGVIERFENYRREKLGSIEFLVFVYAFMGGVSTVFAILVNMGILSI